jgi:hypothetical protein
MGPRATAQREADDPSDVEGHQEQSKTRTIRRGGQLYLFCELNDIISAGHPRSGISIRSCHVQGCAPHPARTAVEWHPNREQWTWERQKNMKLSPTQLNVFGAIYASSELRFRLLGLRTSRIVRYSRAKKRKSCDVIHMLPALPSNKNISCGVTGPRPLSGIGISASHGPSIQPHRGF